MGAASWLRAALSRLRARVSRHRRWYTVWAAVLAASAVLLGVHSLLVFTVFIALDELYVMRHGFKARDVLGYRDKRCGCWMPSHELLMLATLIAYALALVLLHGRGVRPPWAWVSSLAGLL